MSRKFTQEEFLKKVRENNHNDIDYSNFLYQGNNVKGMCKCNVCGHVWFTVPMSLFKGCGCPKCAIEYKARNLSKNKDAFIEESLCVHGKKYDYSKVEYVNDKTNVDIVCPIHGIFSQKPCLHLRGHGCPKCADSGVKLTQKEFEDKINQLHPNIDLSEFTYVNATTNGKCKCKTCGYEWESSYFLLKSSVYGCPSCALRNRTKKRTDDLQTFVKKLKERFPNNKYDFSISKYINSLTKMDVICPTHGVFKIRPNDLIEGHGCPNCINSMLERKVEDALKENGIEYELRKYHPWLLNEETNYHLTLDFYLPRYSIAIECQGEQHFEAVGYFGGKENLEKTQKRDITKKQLCKDKGVKLIYFLDKRNNKYMKDDDIYFNDVNDIIMYVKGMETVYQ